MSINIPARDKTIDVLRGLAIVTMVAANMAATILQEPHPFVLRIYGTFAAPLFILLAGLMVAYSAQKKQRPLRYFLWRSILILAVAILLDSVLFRIMPLLTMDVLYLIGLAIFCTYGMQKLPLTYQWVIVLLIFLATPLSQSILGYAEVPTQIGFNPEPDAEPVLFQWTTVMKHWVIDGWFPAFPWLGFAFVGAIWAKYRLQWGTFYQRYWLLTGLGLLGFGVIYWWQFPGLLLTRDGYSELFYPPTWGYMITATGLIMLLFYGVDKKPDLPIYQPLRLLGECSLLMYITHLVIINFLPEDQPLGNYLLIYLAVLTSLVLLGMGIRLVKQKWVKLPLFARFLLGG